MGTTEEQATLDREFVEDFAHRYGEAWRAREPDRIAALVAEDVVWLDPALPEVLHGRDAVREFATETIRMAPDLDIEELGDPFIAPAEPRVLLRYRMAGTMTGPWKYLDVAPTGRPFSFEGVDDWVMRYGLIAEYRTHYDSMGMSRQIGLLPEHGSAAERAFARLQHAQARFQRRGAR